MFIEFLNFLSASKRSFFLVDTGAFKGSSLGKSATFSIRSIALLIASLCLMFDAVNDSTFADNSAIADSNLETVSLNADTVANSSASISISTSGSTI